MLPLDLAQAALVQQQANLATVLAGPTPEAIAAAQAQVAAAQTTLDNARGLTGGEQVVTGLRLN